MFRESFDADKERSEELAVQKIYDQMVLSLKSKENFFLEKIQEMLANGSSIQTAIQKIVYPHIQKTDIYQKTISAPATLDEAISRYEDMITEKVQNSKNREDDENLHTDIDLKDIFTDEGRVLTPKESEKFDIYTQEQIIKNLDDHPIQLPLKSEVSPQQRNDLKTIVTDLKEMIPDKHLDYRNILLDFFQETSDFQNISVEDMDTIVENITKKYRIHGEENAIHLKDCLIRAKNIL